jgi:hypothetical protein
VRTSHPEQIVAVGPALHDQLREPIEQSHEPPAVGRLHRLVGQHKRRWRLRAAVHRLDVSAQLPPAPKAVSCREVAARLGKAHAIDRSDATRAARVVRQVHAKRLLERQALNVRFQLGPTGKAQLTRQLELHVSQRDLLTGRTPLVHTLLGLLAQLLEIELKRHGGFLPSRRASACSGWRGSVFATRQTRRVGSALSADWMRPSPPQGLYWTSACHRDRNRRTTRGQQAVPVSDRRAPRSIDGDLTKAAVASCCWKCPADRFIGPPRPSGCCPRGRGTRTAAGRCRRSG